MEFDEVVRKRRMVHRFERRQVPEDVLRGVLDTALHAPSAGFSQGLELVVLREPANVDHFYRTTDPEELPEQQSWGPPTVVLVYVDSAAYTARYAEPDKIEFGLADPERWPVPYWYVDAGMSVLLMLQAAVNQGLGGWFFGIDQGERQLRDELGIPAGLRFVGVVGLGFRAASDRPIGSAVTRPRRSLDHVAHLEHW